MDKEDFFKKLKEFEGYSEHMYLDSKGYITIGYGLLLSSETKAADSNLGFYDRKTGEKAKAEDIKGDYQNVRDQDHEKLKYPNDYKKHTSLNASEKKLDEEFKRRVAKAEKQARKFYSGYDELPSTAKYALLDMSYNLGGNKLGAYRKLKAALLEGDWEKAAKESYRNGPSESRNDKISDWFKKAATTK